MNRSLIVSGWFVCVSSSACGASPDVAAVSEPALPDAGPAPTYTQLFEDYFAPGKPGHCATSGCHADPGHNVWLCGTTKDSCYQGMVGVGLIDAANPRRSSIADPVRSPLTWFNMAGGNMPFDAQGEDPEGRDAITAWVAAGAQDN